MADSQRKTANLFDYQSVAIGKYIDANGVEQTSASSGHGILNHSNTINITPNTSYSFKIRKMIGESAVTNAFCWFDENMTIISRDMADFSTGDNYIEMTFTSPANATYLIINFRDNYYNTGMCNTGSTALPYEPYGWVHSLRKLGTGTDSITTFPTTIYADGETIGVNMLNTEDTQQTFPAGTYYIYSDSPDANIAYYDNVGEYPTIYGVAGTGNVFTATTSLVVQASLSSLPKGMVAKSSTEVPFQPYSNCTIIGNMAQSGTPTPQNPITPSETGEMTGNLFDKTDYVAGKYIDASGNEQTSSGAMNHSNYITVSANSEYTLSSNKPYFANVTYAIAWYDSNKTFISRDSWLAPDNQGRYDFTGISPNNAAYAIINFALYPSYANEQLMLNTGSEALPYEPYGIKIPISSASTTTPVYLGEVESTRKVYKWELTGEEDWLSSQADSSKHYLSTVSPDYIRANSQVTYVSSHYVAYEQTTSATLVPNGSFSMASNTTAQRLYIADATYTTNDTWKAYLAQQYAAGTPVTVWYVLANETTTTLNEPLRKIGDYADTVSGITIPTITGKDTFDVDTTLKPSEVELTYTGWHDASAKEWDGSEWQ